MLAEPVASGDPHRSLAESEQVAENLVGRCTRLTQQGRFQGREQPAFPGFVLFPSQPLEDVIEQRRGPCRR